MKVHNYVYYVYFKDIKLKRHQLKNIYISFSKKPYTAILNFKNIVLYASEDFPTSIKITLILLQAELASKY